MPNQTPPPSDAPLRPRVRVDYHPALSLQALRHLDSEAHAYLAGYGALPTRTLSEAFLEQVDPTAPIAVHRTHLEQFPGDHGALPEALVVLCSFAPLQPGPRLINELICKPGTYDLAVGEMTIQHEIPPATGVRGMVATMLAPPQLTPEEVALVDELPEPDHGSLPRGTRIERFRRPDDSSPATPSAGNEPTVE